VEASGEPLCLALGVAVVFAVGEAINLEETARAVTSDEVRSLLRYATRSSAGPPSAGPVIASLSMVRPESGGLRLGVRSSRGAPHGQNRANVFRGLSDRALCRSSYW